MNGRVFKRGQQIVDEALKTKRARKHRRDVAAATRRGEVDEFNIAFHAAMGADIDCICGTSCSSRRPRPTLATTANVRASVLEPIDEALKAQQAEPPLHIHLTATSQIPRRRQLFRLDGMR
jgi:hypothetical protein